MIRKLSFIFAVIMILSLSACAKKTTGSEADNTDSQTTASDQSDKQSGSVKINVTVPDGWKPIEGTVIDAQYMKNTASFMAKKENGFSGKDLDSIVDEAKDIFSGSFTGVDYIGETEKIKVGGKDAASFTFTATVSNMDMKYRYVYIPVGNTVFAITFGDFAGTFDSLSADYDDILSSISFS